MRGADERQKKELDALGGGWLLAFDLSVPCGVLALHGPGSTLSREVPARERTAFLFSEIHELMDEAGVSREEIALLGAGRGPGSFTGVRVAVTAAKTLAFALGVPLVAPESLAVAAAGVGSPGRLVFVAMDARRGEVYYGIYRVEDGYPRTLLPPRVAPPEQAARELSACLERCGGEAVLTGTGIAAYPGVWPAGAGVAGNGAPSVEGLVRLCRMAAERGETVDPFALRPLYVRRPDTGKRREKGRCAW
ncbi:MAG: tRNA (adenosine(37)-N6)-threonylcarbamoyltransferase complex dimerization subunit type 1 TsaB [Actinomycetota bacterium]|nr:tRNA (adenosine(37)-N6)-threonylcarbamoyltransferase complex dimerization subunit type 1 TsaB [Actinomycetota bacterium]